MFFFSVSLINSRLSIPYDAADRYEPFFAPVQKEFAGAKT
jgi:hypothetical protein